MEASTRILQAYESNLPFRRHSRLMKGAFFLLCALVLALPLRADDFKYSFYDPSRPGRHLVDSVIVPEPHGNGDKTRLVKIYTLLDYPMDGSPVISATLNGKPLTVTQRWRPNAGLRWVKLRAEVPAGDLSYAKNGAANVIKLTVTQPNGTKFTRELTIKGVGIPEVEQSRVIGSYLEKTGLKYSLSYRLPPSPITLGKDIPVLGKYGLNFQMNGRMNISPFEQTCATETMGGAGIILGGQDISMEAGTKDGSEWQTDKWVKTQSKLYVGLSTSFTLWEKNLLSVMPEEGRKTLDYIPFLGPKFRKTLEEVKVSATMDPSLYGEFNLPLTPSSGKFIESAEIGGELDIKCTASAILELQGLGKFGAQIMIGGKVDLQIDAAPNLAFQNFSGELYLGADFYFLAFESKSRYTLAEFHLPPTPTPPQVTPPAEEEADLELVPPPKADEKLEYPLAPAPQGAQLQTAAPALAADEAMFNRLGSKWLSRQSVMPMSSGTKPVIEAGATLPIALNTTSVAWPGMASNVRSGGMLILFGADKRPAGSTDTTASQFTEVRWTYFRNGEWTAPTPLPPGNGAAQIAPSVAVLSEDKSQYIAAWQQLADPNFKGASVKDWLDETQVSVGIFQAEDAKGNKVNTWTTKFLGEPGRVDLSPKVSGGLWADRDEGMVMWVSASVADVQKNEGAKMPDNAEFRFAICKAGQWSQPAAGPKAPEGLLSWDFAAVGPIGYLVYSEDIGDGKSRIMGSTFNYMQKTWTRPVEYSKVAGKNLNPRVMLKAGSSGGTAIVWNENGSVVVRTAAATSTTKEVLRPASEGETSLDVTLTALHAPNAGDAGMAVSWTEQTPDGAGIMTSVFDPTIQRWGKPMAITSGEGMDTLYAASTDAAGNLVPLYVHTDISYGDVTAPDENGRMVTVPNSPIPGREQLMIGRFRPTRDLGFAPAAISVNTQDFVAGTAARLTAHVKSEGMLGFPSVSVSFYHGDPKKGGKLIATGKSTKPLAGGGAVDVSVEWKLAEDIWDRDDSPLDVYAVIQKPEGLAEWNPDNNAASMQVDEIVLSATASADSARLDGSADVDLEIRNGGYPYTDPFPVKIYDSFGTRLITEEVVPKVAAGGVSTANVELPKGSVPDGYGADFLLKVDPDNTLKLPGNPKVETKVHIAPATR